MALRDDTAHVFGFLRTMVDGNSGGGPDWVARLRAAFEAAQRLHIEALNEVDLTGAGFTMGLRDEDDVAGLRKLGVSRGWFEVPSGSYEKLRMIDGASGNHLIVYFGKRGLKAVANVGHPNARALLAEWKKQR